MALENILNSGQQMTPKDALRNHLTDFIQNVVSSKHNNENIVSVQDDFFKYGNAFNPCQ